jgi:multidrug transporter EmrE-like cation transporter
VGSFSRKLSMNISQIIMVSLFSIGMGVGQILFKFCAQRQSINVGISWLPRLTALVSDWTFLLGVAFYGLLLIYWIWLLTFLPLSRAYPFTLLSIAVATTGCAIFFHEPISISFIVGLAIILVGLVVLSSG